MRLTILVATLTTLSTLAGCSSSKDETAPLATAAEACAAMHGFIVGFYADCFGYAPEAAASIVAADPGLDCAGWSAAVAGGVTYDPDKAQACISTLESFGCNQIAWANETGVDFLPHACSEVFAGTGVAADPCAFDFECASGRCVLPAACDAVGACADAPGEGETCAGAEPHCAGGLVCDAGTCALPTPIPAPVAVTEDCSAAPCVDAAYCRAADSICVARPTATMACSATNPCAYGARCVSSICEPIVPVGGACTFSDYDCAAGASCVAISTMAPGTHCEPWGHAGAKCGISVDLVELTSEFVGCVDAWCYVPTGLQGTCQAYTAVGEPCETGTGECGSPNGFACDPGTLLCERLTCTP